MADDYVIHGGRCGSQRRAGEWTASGRIPAMPVASEQIADLRAHEEQGVQVCAKSTSGMRYLRHRAVFFDWTFAWAKRNRIA